VASSNPPTTSRTTLAAVRLVAINKRFGSVQANRDVSITVPAGSIHGIVGENGAGKSTLMSILYGFYTADSGTIEIEGKSARIRNPHEAIALGIGMVYQHFMLVDKLSALDNILLGTEPYFNLKRSQAKAQKELNDLIQDTGLQVDLHALVEDLSVGDRQRLEILKALHRGARIVILDEPTAVLTSQEAAQLFAVLRRLQKKGKTIILITHKLREVLTLCDQVTVMRDGQVVEERIAADSTCEQLAQAMVGRQLHSPPVRRSYTNTPVQLRVQALQYTDIHRIERLLSLSFNLHASEILGIAGVAGNGQTELLEILSGMRRPNAGNLEVLGHRFDASNWLNPQTARELGIAHVPEDRHDRGLVLPFSAWESAVLGYEKLPIYAKGLWTKSYAMQHDTEKLMKQFDVRPPNPQLHCSKFSGGNQQKLILAREFHHAPKVLLIGQPTRGVDIGAIEFIHAQLRLLRDEGCAILLVSTELEEILALSDRVIVMNQGQITGELPIDRCDERSLGLLMVSQTSQSSKAYETAL
jgi:general nucleoside transport system ATP-binding protein